MGELVKKHQGMKGAQRLATLQLCLALLLASVALCYSGDKAALSALLGGIVAILPNVFFARKLFQYRGARAAKQIVNNFYKGEALKIILSIILFVLVFRYTNVMPLVFFIVYITVQMMFWFAPLIF
jgi:ATP synthase protein I